jgi:hypothetical protein
MRNVFSCLANNRKKKCNIVGYPFMKIIKFHQ